MSNNLDESIVFTISIPAIVAEELRQIAYEKDIILHEAIRECLVSGVGEYKRRKVWNGT